MGVVTQKTEMFKLDEYLQNYGVIDLLKQLGAICEANTKRKDSQPLFLSGLIQWEKCGEIVKQAIDRIETEIDERF